LDNFITSLLGENILTFVLVTIPIIVFVALFALYAVLGERKISAWIQNRVGPNRVGKGGMFQTLIDGLKLIQKEFVSPLRADKYIFNLAPIIVFTASFMGFAVIPFSSIFIGADLNLGLFYFFAITSLGVIGLMIAGWSSNNKYSLYGAVRSISQIVSYEIPTALAAIPVVMLAGSLSMQTIINEQAGGILNWYIFGGPGTVSKFILFPFMLTSAVILFVSTLAETNRTPFDIVEADSEIVAGVHIEYSGMKFAMFFFAEYAQMFAVAAIVSTLFLGGWQSPFGDLIPALNNPWVQFGWSISKALILVFIQIWLRWTLPRLRVDQLMTVCWKYLIPITLINLFIVGLYAVL